MESYSFDVFMGRSAKSRNVDLTPDVAYLYKDLSEYYKNKYPQAGAEENPAAGWVIMNGNRIQIKRKQFEKMIDTIDTI